MFPVETLITSAPAYLNACAITNTSSSEVPPSAQSAAESYADGLAGNYETSGAVSTHAALTSTHCVTGSVVGTSDSQTLTNKTIGDALTFNDGSNNSTIDVNGNNLSISASADLTLSTSTGDIILNPDNFAYIGSASDGNKIATNSYVDNAVSGLNWKQAVNLLAHTSVALTGNATTTSIDGHSLSDADGYRVLLTGQSTDSENGIYDVDVTAGTYTFTRSADADTYTELVGAAGLS